MKFDHFACELKLNSVNLHSEKNTRTFGSKYLT